MQRWVFLCQVLGLLTVHPRGSTMRLLSRAGCARPAGSFPPSTASTLVDVTSAKKTPKTNLSNSWILPLCSQPTRQFLCTPAAGKAFPFVQLPEEISVACCLFPVLLLCEKEVCRCTSAVQVCKDGFLAKMQIGQRAEALL